MAQVQTELKNKAVMQEREIYSLSIENLSDLVSYSPDAAAPDSLNSKVNLPAGALLSPITTATEVTSKKWSTVQVSKDKHIELNSALRYINHSCDPSLEVDTHAMEVRVANGRDLKVGDELSFFYPSTEWKMDSPFACLCGAGSVCLGVVTGAADIEVGRLGTWFLNKHIIELKQEQGAGRENNNNKK